jgi:acetoin:2,6-dichlorophenolindophenol oxidoreductase subunit alpha
MTLNKETYFWLYKTMLRIRLAEESLVEPIYKGVVRCPVHLYSGEEAVATGIGAHLKQKDMIFGNHRSHGHYLAKGGSLKAMMAEIYCKETGCSKGRGGSMHLIDPENGIMGITPIVAGTISLALGAALAAKIRNDNSIVVTFFGDGATGEGVLFESLNFASLKKLPIIFACENNLYSTHLPINEIRTNTNIDLIAHPFDIQSFKIDGNDVLKVYEATEKAAASCRNGQGPVFMELLTYRLRGHVGPDDNVQGSHTDIRPPEEFEAWKLKDPIIQYENWLIRNNHFSDSALQKIRNEVETEVAEAKEFAEQSFKPPQEEVLHYVYE